MKKVNFVFFGSSKFSLIVLDELEKAGCVPRLIVTSPDKKIGRGLHTRSSDVKIWAETRHIPVLTPERLKDPHVQEELKQASVKNEAEVFVTASYGKIIPQAILNIPKHGTLNIHPSLLPEFRGPSPIESAILEPHTNGKAGKTGVTIMLTDEEVDHGPIIAQKEIVVPNWPPYAETLEDTLAREGAILLAETLPKWISGEIQPQEQKHGAATFTKKFTSEDGLVNLEDDPHVNIRKIRAFHQSPGAYFFIEHTKTDQKIRVKIKTADIEDGALKLGRIVPEGKKEMNYEDFLRGVR